MVAVYDFGPGEDRARGLRIRGAPTSTQLDEGHRERRRDIAVIAVPGDGGAAGGGPGGRGGNHGDHELRADRSCTCRPEVTLKTVNMAMELEGLSFALTNRE